MLGVRHGLGCMFFGALTIACIIFAPLCRSSPDLDDVAFQYAHAHPKAVCNVFDAQPDASGLKLLANTMMASGLTPQQTGQVIWYSVATFCPEHLITLRNAIDEWKKEVSNNQWSKFTVV